MSKSKSQRNIIIVKFIKYNIYSDEKNNSSEFKALVNDCHLQFYDQVSLDGHCSTQNLTSSLHISGWKAGEVSYK